LRGINANDEKRVIPLKNSKVIMFPPVIKQNSILAVLSFRLRVKRKEKMS
jgi:hypothetical protein